MSIRKIFKCYIPSCSYFFKNGKQAAFLNGQYTTDNQQEISELMAEVGEIGKHSSKHPHIYVDADEQEIDSDALSPLEELKRKAREEVLAEMAAASNATNDMGTSIQGKLIPASSKDVEATAAGQNQVTDALARVRMATAAQAVNVGTDAQNPTTQTN